LAHVWSRTDPLASVPSAFYIRLGDIIRRNVYSDDFDMIDFLPGEKIIVGMRKHWFVFFMQISGLIFAAIIPIILLPFYRSIFSTAVSSLGPEKFQNLEMFFIGGWLFMLFIAFFITLTGYYLDILIVTNERIIDVDQVSLFARDIASAPLEKIEDVKVQTLGIIATFFKFGSISIQTAGTAREMIIHGIRFPEYARDTIMRAYEEAKRKKV
jgi:hypothetical protein